MFDLRRSEDSNWQGVFVSELGFSLLCTEAQCMGGIDMYAPSVSVAAHALVDFPVLAGCVVVCILHFRRRWGTPSGFSAAVL